MSEEPGTSDATALAATRSDWAALSTAASEGRLRLEPGAAERCAVACETLREELLLQQRNVSSIGRVMGFGSLGSGRELAAKFEAKAVSGREVLGQHIAVLEDMAATFRAAKAAFQAQEQSNASAVGSQS